MALFGSIEENIPQVQGIVLSDRVGFQRLRRLIVNSLMKNLAKKGRRIDFNFAANFSRLPSAIVSNNICRIAGSRQDYSGQTTCRTARNATAT